MGACWAEAVQPPISPDGQGGSGAQSNPRLLGAGHSRTQGSKVLGDPSPIYRGKEIVAIGCPYGHPLPACTRLGAAPAPVWGRKGKGRVIAWRPGC